MDRDAGLCRRDQPGQNIDWQQGPDPPAATQEEARQQQCQEHLQVYADADEEQGIDERCQVNPDRRTARRKARACRPSTAHSRRDRRQRRGTPPHKAGQRRSPTGNPSRARRPRQGGRGRLHRKGHSADESLRAAHIRPPKVEPLFEPRSPARMNRSAQPTAAFLRRQLTALIQNAQSCTISS